jgi:hypothetical protein
MFIRVHVCISAVFVLYLQPSLFRSRVNTFNVIADNACAFNHFEILHLDKHFEGNKFEEFKLFHLNFRYQPFMPSTQILHSHNDY